MYIYIHILGDCIYYRSHPLQEPEKMDHEKNHPSKKPMEIFRPLVPHNHDCIAVPIARHDDPWQQKSCEHIAHS